MVLIGGAALALIVVSAVVTGMFVSGKPEPKPAPGPAVQAAAPVPTPAPLASKVVVQAPVISLPQVQAVAPTAAPTPFPVVAKVLPPAPAPKVVSAPPAPAPVAAAAESRNDIIQGIVDRYRISGVRAAGADSKALVDGHVYKVNEIIDRTIGLRLVKVDADHLTFVDAQGETYTRSF